VLVVDDAKVHGEFPQLSYDLLLHEVDAHGHDGQAHQHVDASDDQLGLRGKDAIEWMPL
jgi:hypothetical protein